MSKYIESTTRTDNLCCVDVIFEIRNGNMSNVYCPECSKFYEQDMINDSMHPYDPYSLGQE